MIKLAASRSSFTSDDLWQAMREEHPGLSPGEPRACGSLFLAAARKKWIAKTNMTITSAAPACHGRDKRVWVSLLWGSH